MEELWGSRSDVMIKVFLRLPLEDLLQIRLVCKQWHSLVGSCEFLNLWKRSWGTRSQQAWICIQSWKKQKSLRKLVSQAWCPIGGTRLPFPFSTHPPNTHFEVLACSQGLVFGRGICCNNPTLHIGNPLTSSWRELPLPFTSIGCHQATLEVDPTSSSYRIGLFGALPILVFDSKTNLWSSASYYRSGSRITDHLAGSLYMDKLPNSVICYDMSSRAWSEVEVSGFPDKSHQRLDVMVWSSMYNHQGRHIRASALRDDNNKLWYEVWELLPDWSSRMGWRMLSSTRLELEDISLEGSFIFVKAGDLLVIYLAGRSSQLEKKSPRVVVYNIQLSSWHALEERFEGVFVPNFLTTP